MKLTSRRKSRKFFANFFRSRKRLIRFSLVSANLAVLLLAWFVVSSTPASRSVSQLSAKASPLTQDVLTGPLDQVSSADIAVHIARAAGLPETASVTNHADSVIAAAVSGPADNAIVAKPQVAGGVLPTYKDIQEYTTVAGDTLASLAVKFSVSSDSIKWSNSLSGNNLTAGKKLVMPPAGMNGIVYTVSGGDTPASLAQRYSANQEAIIAFNDAEVSGLRAGSRILIPNGSIAAPTITTSYNYYSSSLSSASLAWGNTPIYGGSYPFGWCTYYAAQRGGAASNWGNAYSWDNGARATPGWTVSRVPVVGAIAQRDGGYGGLGHVAIVDAVSEDGSQIKYSDMNGIAGWGKVGYSDWVSVREYQNYIYR